MIKRHARRHFRRLIIVFVLAAAFVATSPDLARQKAAAAPTFRCTVCETNFNSCVDTCESLGNPFLCHNQCVVQYNFCISHCS
jgi:hypothetical protein